MIHYTYPRLRKNRLVKNILQYILTNILYWCLRIVQYNNNSIVPSPAENPNSLTTQKLFNSQNMMVSHSIVARRCFDRCGRGLRAK